VAESLAFDRIADDYDRTRGGEDRGRRFAAELAPLFDRDRPIVEVGVGTGLVALGLTELGFRVVGLDLSEAMARRAVLRVGPRVAIGDALRLPLRDGAIHHAFSVWVLHVVADLGAALREVARVLAPGGRYVAVPARGQHPGDPIGRAIRELERCVDPEGRHSDSVERLERAAPDAGLVVREVRRWPPHDYMESPAEAIAKIESRSYSILWRVPDDLWREAATPALEMLRAIPNRASPIRRSSTDPAVVFERAR
jgi:ubiquinone/menaquinone biosynthesis C-methylase UbiE